VIGIMPTVYKWYAPILSFLKCSVYRYCRCRFPLNRFKILIFVKNYFVQPLFVWLQNYFKRASHPHVLSQSAVLQMGNIPNLNSVSVSPMLWSTWVVIYVFNIWVNWFTIELIPLSICLWFIFLLGQYKLKKIKYFKQLIRENR